MQRPKGRTDRLYKQVVLYAICTICSALLSIANSCRCNMQPLLPEFTRICYRGVRIKYDTDVTYQARQDKNRRCRRVDPNPGCVRVKDARPKLPVLGRIKRTSISTQSPRRREIRGPGKRPGKSVAWSQVRKAPRTRFDAGSFQACALTLETVGADSGSQNARASAAPRMLWTRLVLYYS